MKRTIKKCEYIVLILILATFISGCQNTVNFSELRDGEKTEVELFEKETEPLVKFIDDKSAETENAEQTAASKPEKVTVTWVTDGDTIKVRKEDENEQVCRLVLINTPESVHPDDARNSAYGEMASDYTKSIVKEGDIAWITMDEEGDQIDQYGRALTLFWFSEPPHAYTEQDVSEKTLNAKLVKDGYALAYPYTDYLEYEELFHDLEFEARNDHRGLWADSGYWKYIGME